MWGAKPQPGLLRSCLYIINKLNPSLLQWDLVCSKSGMGEITQSLFIAGQGIGALVFPSFADHYGRKPIHILSNFIMVISAGISAMAPSYWIFAPTRLLCGICQQVIFVFISLLLLNSCCCCRLAINWSFQLNFRSRTIQTYSDQISAK